MIKTTESLLAELKDYSQPINKIHRLINDNRLFPLRRGLYETQRNVNPFYLSGSICSPSYISFETALSYYDMIPETVYTIKSEYYSIREERTEILRAVEVAVGAFVVGKTDADMRKFLAQQVHTVLI